MTVTRHYCRSHAMKFLYFFVFRILLFSIVRKHLSSKTEAYYPVCVLEIFRFLRFAAMVLVSNTYVAVVTKCKNFFFIRAMTFCSRSRTSKKFDELRASTTTEPRTDAIRGTHSSTRRFVIPGKMSNCEIKFVHVVSTCAL
jgi:hypothetical protein